MTSSRENTTFLTLAIQKKMYSLKELSSDEELERLMRAVYDDCVAKRMDKDKENMGSVPQGASIQNDLKNMNNCNFCNLSCGFKFFYKSYYKGAKVF